MSSIYPKVFGFIFLVLSAGAAAAATLISLF